MNLKRSANRKYKKEIILEKAIEVFAMKGSQQTTISDIAKAAKIAQGTIYVYFPCKEALLNECMQEIIAPVLQSIIDSTKDIPDTMDRLYEFFILHIRLVEAKPFIARFLTMEARQNEDFYVSFPDYNPLKRYVDYVETITKLAINEKRIRSIDPKAFAILLVGAMDFSMSVWLMQKEKMDIEKVAQSIRDILKYGINE
ncbi:MAG: TetR/AcrR family transcriptional regulator [Candidatus Cloacimonetes bacterium]|jgi:TetR/AcrR family fatty acid metabolism transcriptional regulator|nr:TetR/AcrR family transcriptional regulator [Candidatus Cloacimonadota bacterium]MDD2506419.1 TetR/AcrR family transcriptional regulator [Candidatus Cloacimonadota bacterium]MDD4559768.1 TetR/AcrR family transcriptional regulator [Candidatus Cloacimonadota bacterium]